MQIILVAAAVVSLVIKEWSTGGLLTVLTVVWACSRRARPRAP
jgi:hypothetical protein